MDSKIISIGIIIVFLCIIMAVGYISQRKVKNTSDYTVASRNAPLFLVVGTVFATFWGGGVVIGATGTAYGEGIYGIIEDPFATGLSLIIIGIFFVSTLRELKLTSVGELYSRRFGKNMGYTATIFMVFTYIIWTAVQLLAISKVLNVLFDLNELVTYIIATIIVIAFTSMGGMLAVVWTDAIQMVIIFIGLIIVIVVGVQEIGSFGEVLEFAPENYWNIMPRDYSSESIWLYIAMWTGMALGNVPSPDIAQRAFIAKDKKTAKRGMIIAGVMYCIIGFIPLILALIAIGLVGQGKLDAQLLINDSELLVPLLAMKLLNPVLLGVFAASLIAAILSSASTALFTTSILISNDVLFNVTNREFTDRQRLVITKLTVIFVGIVASLIGLVSTNIYDMTIFAFIVQFGVLFFPFILIIKAKWITKQGVYAGMFASFLIIVYGSISSGSFIPTNYTFYTLVPAAVNFAMILIISLLTKSKNVTILKNKEE